MQILQTEYPKRRWPAAEALLTGHEYREEYLLPLAETSLVKECLCLGTRVVQVGRSRERAAWRLLLEDQLGRESIAWADAVLDCTGVYGQPRWLGDGDMPAAGERAARHDIVHGVVDILGQQRERFAGRTIMVVGSGYSAATNVVALASLAEEHRDTWIYWVSHGGRGQPLPRLANDPLKERDRLAARANLLATRGDGHVEFIPQTVLDEIRHLPGTDSGFLITGRRLNKLINWEVDYLISCVGYTSMTITNYVANSDGYFVLGAKTDAKSFLLRDGQMQMRRVLRALVGVERLARLRLEF
jgi:hypothetical protein